MIIPLNILITYQYWIQMSLHLGLKMGSPNGGIVGAPANQVEEDRPLVECWLSFQQAA